MPLLHTRLLAHQWVSSVGRAARWSARKVISTALWHVPRYSRSGMYPQALFVIIALIWFEYQPEWSIQGPSVAMGFLAVAAIYMAVRGPDSTPVEGAVWIAISFFLFAGEMHSISTERRMHETEQADLRNREESTRQAQDRSFTQLIRDGESLFAALSEEKKLTAKNLEYITGGDEYCWLIPEPPLPIAVGGYPAPPGNNYWELAVKNSGNVVLPTCDVRFMPFPTVQEIKTGHFGPPQLMLTYHFEKIPAMSREESRITQYFVTGDRIYSGVIETPTRSLSEVIKFEPDPIHVGQYIPRCTVTSPAGKTLQKECYPQVPQKANQKEP